MNTTGILSHLLVSAGWLLSQKVVYFDPNAPGYFGGNVTLIGIVGKACSGKRTVGQLISEYLDYDHESLSDYVAQDAQKMKGATSRKEHREFANERREKHGGHVWVSDLLGEYRFEAGDTLVVSGIYCVPEANYLLDAPRHAILIYVEGPSVEDRFLRLEERALNRSSTHDFMEKDLFVEVDNDESTNVKGTRPATDAIRALIPPSHWISNIGSLEDLSASVRQLCDLLNLPKRSRTDTEQRKGVGIGVSRPYVDRLPDLLRLERRRLVLEVLRERLSLSHTGLDPLARALSHLNEPAHTVQTIEEQFGRRLVDAFLGENGEIRPGDEALRLFKGLEAHTTDEELVLLTNDVQVLYLVDHLRSHLSERRDSITRQVKDRMKDFPEADEEQFSNKNRSSLNALLNSGLSFKLQGNGTEIIRRAQKLAKESERPVLELVKRERIIEATKEKEDSKVSHIVHDVVDHVWVARLFRDRGLHERHKPLFQAIGDPLLTDLFTRSGEVLASIAYGVRSWGNLRPGFVPLLDIAEIAKTVDRLLGEAKFGDIERVKAPSAERSLPAFATLRRLVNAPAQREAQSLAFVLSNYYVEMDETTRKHGSVKYRDPEKNTTIDELRFESLEFLCFAIDLHSELLHSKNKHRDFLLRTHLWLEEFLRSDECLQQENFYVKIEDIENRDFSDVKISAETINWMARNYGFTAYIGDVGRFE